MVCGSLVRGIVHAQAAVIKLVCRTRISAVRSLLAMTLSLRYC